MKRAFLTELSFTGKVPLNHTNLRTEFAWMILADATHHNIYDYASIKEYDEIYVIIPKGTFNLNVVGAKLSDSPNTISNLLSQPFISTLRSNNSRVYIIQEGPVWMHSDWPTVDQVNWHTNILASNGILCHNISDKSYWRGLVCDTIPVVPIPTVMIDGLTFSKSPIKRHGVLVGGNLSRWYGGYASLVVANEFDTEIWIPDSHSRQIDEDVISGIHHLPRMEWMDWMNTIQDFTVAIHLMPTIAAGSFSLNTGYWGIPTIGNKYMDTQRILFPDLSIHPEDLVSGITLARKLHRDAGFLAYCSDWAKEKMFEFIYAPEDGDTLFKKLRDALDENE